VHQCHRTLTNGRVRESYVDSSEEIGLGWWDYIDDFLHLLLKYIVQRILSKSEMLKTNTVVACNDLD